MPNVQISDLPFAITPLIGATTFFEVEATEGGVVVSRRVAADDLVVSATTLFINGTSVDDPAIGGGVFDGQLLWRNVNLQQTGVFGFDPAGDNFIWSNDAEGGFHQIAIRDGTVLVETIAAAAGGLLANNLLTGAGLERVLTAADLFAGVIIGTSIDDPTNPAGGGTYDGTLGYENSLGAATADVGFDPAGDTLRAFNRVRRGSFAVRVITSGGVEEDTYRYDGFGGTHVWLDVLNGGLVRMRLDPGLSSVTCVAQVNDPVAANAQIGNFTVKTSTGGGGETSALFGFPASGASTTLRMKNFVHGGPIEITGEDGGGVERIIFSGDPDSSSSMSHIGVAVATTLTAAAGGLSANNTLTGAGFERVLTEADLFAGVFIGTSTDNPTVPGGTFDANAQWQNANLLPLANVGFDPAGDTLYLASQVHGGRIVLRGESEAGTIRDVYEIDFENVVGGLAHIWREPGGTRDLMRIDTGINAVTQVENNTSQPSGGFAQVGMFRVRTRNATPETAMFVGFDETITTTTLRLKNFVHGGPLELVGETAAGVERVLFFHDPDQVGPIFTGILDNPTATDASIQDARVTFRNPSAANIWQIGFLDGTNDFSIRLFQDTGLLRLRGSNAASADTTLATFDPVADAKLFQAGAEVFRTVGAAAGGAQANNTLTGAGFERVLTTADLSGSPFTEIILTNSNTIDLVDTDVALNIGSAVPGSNLHLEIGFTGVADLGMQAKADATTTAELELNRLGGNVRVGSQNTAVAGATFLYASNGASAGSVIETVISGMILEGKAGSSTILDWHIVNGNLAMRAVFNGANFQFEGFVNSEEIRFQSRNSAAGVRQMLHLDPDADVEIYHPLTDRIALRTTDLGADTLGENATTGEFGFFSTDGLTERARIRWDAAGIQLSSRVNSLGVSLRVLNGAGAEQVGFSVSGSTGTADMRWTGLVRAITASSGLTIRGNAASNVICLWEGSTGVDIFAMRGEGTRTIWDSVVDSSLLVIRGNNSVSATVECAVFDPDGFAQLKFAGAVTLETRLEGIRVRGDGAATANLTMEGSGGVALLHFDVTTEYQVRGFINGNSMRFTLDDAGGTTRDTLILDPDADVKLFQVGVEVARTTTAALGGFFANNTLTGAGFERVLTIADRRSAEIYAPTNVSTDRAYDADATTLDELADVLGTLIADLQAIDVIQ